jgi:DNA-binding GntR family transcriptional regulator
MPPKTGNRQEEPPKEPDAEKDKRHAPIKARGLMPPVSPREAVANELRRRIQTGVYKPGETIPSIPELIAMAQGTAAKNTIIDATKKLQAEGFVKSIHGIGTFVLTEEYWGNPPEK